MANLYLPANNLKEANHNLNIVLNKYKEDRSAWNRQWVRECLWLCRYHKSRNRRLPFMI